MPKDRSNDAPRAKALSEYRDYAALQALSVKTVASPFVATPETTFNLDGMATYLRQGYWQDSGRLERAFDIEAGGQITVNLEGLEEVGRAAAELALESWTAVSGLEFVQADEAQITFQDNEGGAFNSTVVDGTETQSSYINIHSSWSKYGDYYLQSYMHEIGHALGLGHTGNYNGSARYASDAQFTHDSWQTSIMSYFHQGENPNTGASDTYLATPQLADIAALRDIYGDAIDVGLGDSTYGDGQTRSYFAFGLTGDLGVMIVDTGGTDTIDLGTRDLDQMINLNAGTFSNLNGKIGNLSIADGTVIENAFTGSGDDVIYGNESGNLLKGGAGADQVSAGAGQDYLFGQKGADLLSGDDGEDQILGGAGKDTLEGGGGDDQLAGGAGQDWILGNLGDDRLSGNNGRDTLNGGEGADRLEGGGGRDILVGGAGADVFVFSNAKQAADVIFDFSRAAGDQLDLSGLISETNTQLETVIADGALRLTEGAGDITWLELVREDGALRIAGLAGFDPDAQMDLDWFLY